MSDDVVDWALALRVAKVAVGDAPAGEPPVDLGHLGTDAAARVARRTGLDAELVPEVEWVDRGGWAAMNLESMRALIEPSLNGLPEAPGPVRGAVGAVLGAEIGGLLGLLGRRVLGQFDIRFGDPDDPRRLVLVGPNIRSAATELDVDLVALTTWIGVHEVTHAVQFSGAPWLRDHLGQLTGDLLAGMASTPDMRGLLRLGVDDVRSFVGRLKDQGLAGAMLDDERAETLEAVQSTMALVEGHAEWTMDVVGVDVVPDVGALREALDRRRGSRGPLFELLDRLLGLELKMRQYRDGRRFCDDVVAAGGDELLRRAWDGPGTIPTAPELLAPASWVARVS